MIVLLQIHSFRVTAEKPPYAFILVRRPIGLNFFHLSTEKLCAVLSEDLVLF